MITPYVLLLPLVCHCYSLCIIITPCLCVITPCVSLLPLVHHYPLLVCHYYPLCVTVTSCASLLPLACVIITVCHYYPLCVIITPCACVIINPLCVIFTQLEVMTSYNPLLVSSQLTPLLSTIHTNKRSTTGNMKTTPAAKRKYQPPPMVCVSVCHCYP